MQIECICGFSNYESIDRECYEVTPLGETIKSNEKLQFRKCINCGIIRQVNIPFENNKDYFQFYQNKYEPTNSAYIVKTYEHDRQLAKRRCENYEIGKVVKLTPKSLIQNIVGQPSSLVIKNKYRLIKGKHRMGHKTFIKGDIIEMSAKRISPFMDKFEQVLELRPKTEEKKEMEEQAIEILSNGVTTEIKERLLDVGSGSGAFVDECRELGHEAYGCEISKYSYAKDSSYIYYNQFENINFPTDHFDKITSHDVIEHSLNPIKILSEIFRSLKQEGLFFIDFPNYFDESGKHHWKKEHIWYFDVEQLGEIFDKIGFIIKKMSYPIPSKILFCLQKPKQHRIKILYPPGIGDSYWSIIKTEAFLKREKLNIPDIYIASPREKEFNGHKRAFPFIEMFPFLNSTGETLDNSNPASKNIWNEAYKYKGRTIFKDVLGYDYFISYNGHLRYGEQMENIDSDLECNWFPDMFVSLEQENFKTECIQKYGKYIVFYFVFQGTYTYWTKEFPIESVIQSIEEIVKKTGLTPVFAGAIWDNKKDDILSVVRKSIPNCIDLTGQTTLPQLFGLIKGSQAVVGYPSGLTIISGMLGVKTLIIWNDYYNRDFAWYCCPPSVRNKTYFIENTKGLNSSKLTNRVVDLIHT